MPAASPLRTARCADWRRRKFISGSVTSSPTARWLLSSIIVAGGPKIRAPPPDRMVYAPPFTPKNPSDSTITHTSAWMRRRLVSSATLSRRAAKT
jgi:hypothetical protein